MFYYCTNLTTAPELPATTLADDCYYYMFYNCNKLNYIKMLATDISASGCLSNWVIGVASTGTFVKNPDMNSLPTGYSGIPSGWTVVNDGEESGGPNLTFPVTLVEGDNGELGIKVYEWCKTKSTGAGSTYYFTSNEVIYLEDTLSTYFRDYDSFSNTIAFAPKNGKWTYVLDCSGNLSLEIGVIV
jgi:hypothetical protein